MPGLSDPKDAAEG
ncbi:hypothetical protein AM20_03576 [Mycobacterium tuberculosis TKK_05MA_0020]|nr:hypothetical protein AM20_03576 [Mycobacterium tuberculosis TKK_05MA_0020]KAW13008.1 hypothetical protein AM76_02250 [Mycobacterium tuberculosis TKK_05SA_0054]KBI08755.1 hypothetical protein N103_03984 [Mycobacterium tuberculosis MAL020156]KCI66909.1 hypothetical protein W005_03750 [Mycobacterium tuberculosis TB_RSA95]